MTRSRGGLGLALVGMALGWGCAPGAPDPPAGATYPATFVNPIYEGADPFIHRHSDGTYYFVQTEGDEGIAVWKSDRLTDKGVKRVVWMAPEEGWNSAEVWAPEIHHLDGRWYIYYAASSGENRFHRMGVLESVSDDPQGEYRDRGMLYTGDDIDTGAANRWAIDGTPLEMGGRLYFLWSGWEGEADEQWHYLAKMTNPWTMATNRVRIADNDDYLWERVSESADERGLNEGAQVLRRDGRVHVIYSASGSWQPSYKLGMLSIDKAADPMVPSNWTKHPEPVFQGDDRVHGVGHASYTKSADGTEDWIIYHSKIDTMPGWQRNVRIQPFGWNDDGAPAFGPPIPPGVPIPLPSGETPPTPGGAFSDDFASGRWDRWVYYGYNRFIGVDDGALTINAFPGPGMANHYGSGEKALVRGQYWTDFRASVRTTVIAGEAAGVLFRAIHPAVGYNAVKGYAVLLEPGPDRLVLGTMDGETFAERAATSLSVAPGVTYDVEVRAVGPVIEVSVDGERRLRVEDDTYTLGLVGVHGRDAHARFDNVRIEPVSPGS